MKRNEPLVTIATFETSMEASLARGALQAAGIPAFVPGEDLGTFSRKLGGISTTDLHVFESDHDRAAVELRRMQIRIAEPPENA
jgi:Putative prokaryotic signal transducing protein